MTKLGDGAIYSNTGRCLHGGFASRVLITD